MFRAVAEASAGMVLMHMRGDPPTMRDLTDYHDVVGEVRAYLRERMDAAVAAGVDPGRLCVDPGIGFAKTPEQSLLLLREIETLFAFGRPVLVGPSRKSFIGHVLDLDVDERLEGTAGRRRLVRVEGRACRARPRRARDGPRGPRRRRDPDCRGGAA